METGCWPLCGEFEDSVFEERPERRPGPLASYRAKHCEPQWFHEETVDGDDAEALTIKKFRGDLAYRQGEYQENKATNTDHLTTVLYLQFAICSSLQNLEKTILCLQKLISLHPFNPWNWGRLAAAYLDLGLALSAPSPSSYKETGFVSSDKTANSSFSHSGKDCLSCFPEMLPADSAFSVEMSSSSSQENEEALKNTPNGVREDRGAALLETQMKACASFIRTRLLLQFAQFQQTSFALEKNLRTQQEIEDKMKEFSFKEDTLLLIAEVMGEDIIPEKIKDEVHTEVKCVGSAVLTAMVIASSEEFEDKWFRKIKDCFGSIENQFHTEIEILA
ncbi:uncharacterized protein C8orf76 homolog isoform X3 [Erinaceus europaeus]|uniref:Uncharacterized protein C8orf76 homolog isoform X3 n=1 Tax=Erinaceus europaeus TaxID=9365 RepID=A0A1S3W8L7_ERIEU|nr:uncharacterized protein C8orf76 homolog isoform X3 [Erinaceus europaeus]